MQTIYGRTEKPPQIEIIPSNVPSAAQRQLMLPKPFPYFFCRSSILKIKLHLNTTWYSTQNTKAKLLG